MTMLEAWRDLPRCLLLSRSISLRTCSSVPLCLSRRLWKSKPRCRPSYLANDIARSLYASPCLGLRLARPRCLWSWLRVLHQGGIEEATNAVVECNLGSQRHMLSTSLRTILHKYIGSNYRKQIHPYFTTGTNECFAPFEARVPHRGSHTCAR